MAYLNNVTTTQEVELEIDLIELAYNHVDSVDELKELLEGISSHTVDSYQDELAEKAKEALYDDIDNVGELIQFHRLNLKHSIGHKSHLTLCLS